MSEEKTRIGVTPAANDVAVPRTVSGPQATTADAPRAKSASSAPIPAEPVRAKTPSSAPIASGTDAARAKTPSGQISPNIVREDAVRDAGAHDDRERHGPGRRRGLGSGRRQRRRRCVASANGVGEPDRLDGDLAELRSSAEARDVDRHDDADAGEVGGRDDPVAWRSTGADADATMPAGTPAGTPAISPPGANTMQAQPRAKRASSAGSNPGSSSTSTGNTGKTGGTSQWDQFEGGSDTTAVHATSAAPHPGVRINQYEMIKMIGEGGMGQVFLARDLRLGRRVAIKFLQTGAGELTQRFLVEARTTARCQHENIVVIYEVGEHTGAPYMVLELLNGKPLTHYTEGGQRLPYTRAVEVMCSVLRALAWRTSSKASPTAI